MASAGRRLQLSGGPPLNWPTTATFGDSEGEPRQLIDVGRQMEDRRSALAFAHRHDYLDPTLLALWGTSFSGGHVLSIAARDHDVVAVVAQVPFVDGRAVATSVPMRDGLRCMVAAADESGFLRTHLAPEAAVTDGRGVSGAGGRGRPTRAGVALASRPPGPPRTWRSVR